jgi:hypothetical protein
MREQTQNTTPEALDKWVDEWWMKNGEALVAELVEIAVLPESALHWREGAVRTDSDPDPIVPQLNLPPKPPIELDHLKAMFRAEVERSRRLFQEYQRHEEERVAVNARNLQRAVDSYTVAMHRPLAEELENDPMTVNLIEGVRYAATPRHVPVFDATVYKIAKDAGGASTDPAAEAKREYEIHLATQLSLDPTLYFQPYSNGIEKLDKAAATAALESGIAAGIPLLPASITTLRALVKDMKDDDVALVISAFAADAADLTQLPTYTYAHLPSARSEKLATLPDGQRPFGSTNVHGSPRYLVGQALCTMSMPAKVEGGLEVWYDIKEWPTSGVEKYGDLSLFPPIIKMVHGEGGSLTGACDYTAQTPSGIVQRLKFNVNGSVDEKTHRVDLSFNGEYIWDWSGGTGKLGRVDRFTGTLSGWHDPAAGWMANNASMCQSRGEVPAGSITSTGTYTAGVNAENLKVDPAKFAEMAQPKVETKEVDRWELAVVREAYPSVEAMKRPRPLKGQFGPATFDQYGSFVEGIVKLPNGNYGIMRGTATDETFSLTFWDGRIQGTASLKRQGQSNTWTGPVYFQGNQIDTVTFSK